MLSMTQQFREWLGEQDPDATFEPWNCEACVGYQFLKACGYPVSTCGVEFWWDADEEIHLLPHDVGAVIAWACDQVEEGGAVTFGTLADRLANISARSGDK